MTPTIAAYNFCNQDFEVFLRDTAAAGFEYVAVGFYKGYLDLDLLTLTAQAAGEFTRKLDGHGLKLVAVYGGGTNLMADDGLEALLKCLDNAAHFDIDTFDMGSFGFEGKTPEQIAADEETFVERVRVAGGSQQAAFLVDAREHHAVRRREVSDGLAPGGALDEVDPDR